MFDERHDKVEHGDVIGELSDREMKSVCGGAHYAYLWVKSSGDGVVKGYCENATGTSLLQDPAGR